LLVPRGNYTWGFNVATSFNTSESDSRRGRRVSHHRYLVFLVAVVCC